MNYRLVALAHGPDGSYLERALASFWEHVTPRPSEFVIIYDGAGVPDASFLPALGSGPLPRRRWLATNGPVGYCAATAQALAAAGREGVDWAFHLEHDFVFTRPVDLHELAAVLDAIPHVAQMALMRQPVGTEVAHGGFVNEEPDLYQQRVTGGLPWIETTRNWTGNPSLFRSSFARENPWPVVDYCEGVYGFEIRERRPETTFGLWGEGETWVEHVGVRDHHGFGY